MASITIDGPVGLRFRAQQVTNNARDQQKIVNLLAAIPAAQGGKREAWQLAPASPGGDHNCPKPLGDAIWDFQTFWKAKEKLVVVDGVVDPGRSSLKKMNDLASAAPLPPSELVKRIHDLIPRAAARQASASAMLMFAKVAIDFPDSNNDFTTAALNLVDRCFKIFQAPGVTEAARRNQWRIDIDMINKVYLAGIDFLGDANCKSYLMEATDAEITAKCGGVPGNACTNPGHWSKKDPSDGIFFNKEICPPHTDNWLLDAFTHELAHFCGPMPPLQVKDQAYGDAALLLPRAQALKNAANHAWFGGLAQAPMSSWPSGTYPS